MPAKLHLAHKPTPLWHSLALDRLVGSEVWVKRDDMTGGAEAGNKLRKLEYLLADAVERGATTLITCGAVQSNHARATALVGRRLGLSSRLLLRSRDPNDRQERGNLLLSRLSGASIRFVTPDEYQARDVLMADEAALLEQRGERPYLIPEGGSNGLGALGYVDAMLELAEQQRLRLCPQRFDSVVCACGSGGTAAGLALGVGRYGTASRVDAIAVCDDSETFRVMTDRIMDEARQLRSDLPHGARPQLHDAFIGPGYGVMNDEQRAFLESVANVTGLVLDPVYTGKALFGLSRMDPKPERVLFVHTGGLPGLLA